MAYKAKSTKRRYEESLKAPLLFCYYEQKSGFDDYGIDILMEDGSPVILLLTSILVNPNLKKMIRKESFSLSERRFSKMERLT